MSEDQQNIKAFADLLNQKPNLLSVQDWTDLQEIAKHLTENDAENWVAIQNWIASRPQIQQGYESMKRLSSSRSKLGLGGSKSSTPASQASEPSSKLLRNTIIKNSPLSDPPIKNSPLSDPPPSKS